MSESEENSKESMVMISIFGDKDGSVTRTILELQAQGLLTRKVRLLNVDSPITRVQINKVPKLSQEQYFSCAEVTWPVVEQKKA